MLDAVKERLSDLRSQESKTTDRAYLVLSFYSTLLVAPCAWFYTHIFGFGDTADQSAKPKKFFEKNKQVETCLFIKVTPHR